MTCLPAVPGFGNGVRALCAGVRELAKDLPVRYLLVSSAYC
jgi:hypothetical protein